MTMDYDGFFSLTAVSTAKKRSGALIIHFDGSCEPNPGGVATFGWTLHDPKGTLAALGGGILRERPFTNNCAEYRALAAALIFASKEFHDIPLVIYGDSKLVVEQVNGRWKCKKPWLQAHLGRVKHLLGLFSWWELTWIPREENEEADALSREAYERETGRKYPERRR